MYLLASVESVCIINISTGCYILDNLSNDSEIAHNVETLTGFEDNKGGYIALLIIITCFSGILLLAIGYLIAFHVWLKCKGWTTYEYVLKHREKMNTKKIQPEKDSCDSSFSKIRLDRTLDLSEPPTTNRLKQGNTCHEEQVFTFANSTTINSCPVTIGNSPQEI